MRIVYVAGPFRAPTHWEVLQHIRAAEDMALIVVGLGAMPLCPHTNTGNFHGIRDDDYWLSGTLELLRRCDAMVVCPGWEKSEGTRAEIEEARVKLGIPVFFEVHLDARPFAAWLSGEERIPRAGEWLPR